MISFIKPKGEWPDICWSLSLGFKELAKSPKYIAYRIISTS